MSTALPPGWEVRPIGELLAPLHDGKTLHHGWSPQCEKDPVQALGEEWGVLKTTAVQHGLFLPEHNKKLPSALKPRSNLEVKAGDLLVTCAGPRVRCGVACLVRHTPNRLILSGKMYRFRVRDGIEPEYLEAYLQSQSAQAAIDAMKTGISDSGLNLTHDRFKRLPVPVAPHTEQARIVAEIEKQFTRLDAGTEALRRLQAHLRRYRAAVLKAAFDGNWRRVEFRTLVREPLRNGHSSPKTPNGEGIRTLTLTAVTDGEFIEENTKLTSADATRVRELWLQPGDLLIERSNAPELVGTARVYRGPKNWAIFPDLLIRARLNADVSDRFIEHFFASEIARNYFRRSAQGIAGSMPKISQPTIEALAVPVPARREQDLIAGRLDEQLSQADAILRVTSAALSKASRLRAAILRAAFEGRLANSQEPARARVA